MATTYYVARLPKASLINGRSPTAVVARSGDRATTGRENGRNQVPIRTGDDGAKRQSLIHWPTVIVVGTLALVFVIGSIVGLTLVTPHHAMPQSGVESETFRRVVAVSGDPATTTDNTAARRDRPEQPPQGADASGARVLPKASPTKNPVIPSLGRPSPEPSRDERESTAAAQSERVTVPNPAHASTVAVSHAPTSPKRRMPRTADELCRELMALPEVDLDQVPGTSKRLLNWARLQKDQSIHLGPDLLAWRSEMAGLPFRMGLDCQLGAESTENLQILSRKLRGYLIEATPKDAIDTRHDVVVLRQKLLEGKDGERREWLQSDALPTLMQMLQVEERPIRLLLVEILSQIKGRTSTAALAQRALFDLSDEVREAAVVALQKRSGDEYRQILLAGLRYPWAPVADHAAEAFVRLEDRHAVPQLVSLLAEPDPAAPVSEHPNQVPYVRELVRVNHLRNCLLCHAPSFATTEPVRGLVPTPGQPLPPPTTPYYDGNPTGTFVRADVTYLRPDFSVTQPVANPGAWPVNQRYDYLMRARPATALEVVSLPPQPKPYPQREAVLLALRELTGQDVGRSAEDWQQLLALARTAKSKN